MRAPTWRQENVEEKNLILQKKLFMCNGLAQCKYSLIKFLECFRGRKNQGRRKEKGVGRK